MNRHFFKLLINNIPKSVQKISHFHTSPVGCADLVKTIERNGIREIILNDPKTRNALSYNMMVELHQAITKNLNDNSLRVIVLSAETNLPPETQSSEFEEQGSTNTAKFAEIVQNTAEEKVKSKSTSEDLAKSVLMEPNLIFSQDNSNQHLTNIIFSAGHNLRELTEEKGSESHKKLFAKLTEIIMTIREASVPVIAKVDGQVIGAGCQLVASCDILVCSERTTFSLAATDFGLFASTPAVAITRVMTRMKSAHLLISGLPMSATEANIAGLVSCIAETDKLDDDVNEICCSILRKSRAVIKMGKEFYYKQLGMDIKDAYKAAEDVMVQNLSIHDGKEGVKSFIEKRDPKWKNS